MKFEEKYFVKFNFTSEQINKNLNNASRDLDIAKKDKILEVKFNYAYSALVKTGIALLSYYHIKVKSAPGHHLKIIDKLAEDLNDEAVADIGNIMRSKRNLDFYLGGAEITEKECREYINFAGEVLNLVKAKIA